MLSVGILGGTGPQGRGLARRLASAGHPTILGSRSVERASETAAAIGVDGVTGGTNDEAAAADLVIVTVPYEGHADLLTSLAGQLAGKIVVDCVNPLGFDAQGPYALVVADGSAAQEAQRILPAQQRQSRITGHRIIFLRGGEREEGQADRGLVHVVVADRRHEEHAADAGTDAHHDERGVRQEDRNSCVRQSRSLLGWRG